jgi:hypothetical protein
MGLLNVKYSTYFSEGGFSNHGILSTLPLTVQLLLLLPGTWELCYLPSLHCMKSTITGKHGEYIFVCKICSSNGTSTIVEMAVNAIAG